MSEVTVLLDALARGEERAGEELLLRVYEELRSLAAMHMARELPGHTLQPTALVHEAWLRLVGGAEWKWKGRAYFFASAAQAMRRILIEHARRKAAVKHGGAYAIDQFWKYRYSTVVCAAVLAFGSLAQAKSRWLS